MSFAHRLGLLVTTIILTLVWILVAIPTGIVLRLVGKKVMDVTYRTAEQSYWITRSEKSNDFKLLERQF
jgi:hypothetical protein